jgi:hypothetical protein
MVRENRRSARRTKQSQIDGIQRQQQAQTRCHCQEDKPGLEANIELEIFIVLESRSVRNQVVIYRVLKGPHEGGKKCIEVEEDGLR